MKRILLSPDAGDAAGANAEAAAELKRVNAREAKIKAKLAKSGGALTREQAEASVDNQEKFDAAKAENDAAKKKAAKK